MKTFYALTVDGEIDTLGEYETIDKAMEEHPEDIVWYFDKDNGIELINMIAKKINNDVNPCVMTHDENEVLKQSMKHDPYVGFLSGSALLQTVRGDEDSAQWYKNMYLKYVDENTPPKNEQ